MGDEPKLTQCDLLCLGFLDDKLYATPFQIGKHIYHFRGDSGGSNLIAIGAAVCGRLQKRGMAFRLADLNAWRITPAGRIALTKWKVA